jgi:primosomal protein N' (replication factor Y)
MRPNPIASTKRARVLILTASRAVDTLTYAVPDYLAEVLRPGHRVLVPLRSDRVTGLVLSFEDNGGASAGLKPIMELLDSTPVLDSPHLELLCFSSRYYMASMAAVCRAVIPAALRVETKTAYKVVRTPNAIEAAALSAAEHQVIATLTRQARTASQISQIVGEGAGVRSLAKLEALGFVTRFASSRGAHRQALPTYVRVATPATPKALRGARSRRLLEILSRSAEHAVATDALAAAVPGGRSLVRALLKRGILENAEADRGMSALSSDEPLGFEINADQRAALAAIAPAVEQARPQTFLLWGVTGSGKTEIYLRLTERCVKQGRNALVLIPEIGLTEHLIGAFSARFGSLTAVLHSAQRTSERWAGWSALRDGSAKIAIGPRSAIFAPMSNLGLLIVDEEHDSSYKQEEGVRYNARDLAVALGGFSRCPVVLGSATPCAESYANARRGRYRLISLTRRIFDRPMPEVEILDLRKQAVTAARGVAGARGRHAGADVPLSSRLIEALRENVAAGAQSIVFLNRRGYHNALQCRFCGAVMCCSACSVSLNFHLQDHSLRCHYCGQRKPAPANCPECGAYALEGQGFGTERIASALSELLPHARIERMDSDASRRRSIRTRIFGALAAGDIDILVGTQMVAKGFDFPAVTLVGVVLADQTLNLPDFRAAERTFQLLTQVAGRAGRGERPGRVLIQTFAPHHYSIQAAKAHDYARFMRRELMLRREFSYPPYAKLAMIRLEGTEQPRVTQLAEETARALAAPAAPGDLRVVGPSPAPIERLKGRYRWQLLVKAGTTKSIQQALAHARERVEKAAKRDNVRLILDIDPVNML